MLILHTKMLGNVLHHKCPVIDGPVVDTYFRQYFLTHGRGEFRTFININMVNQPLYQTLMGVPHTSGARDNTCR